MDVTTQHIPDVLIYEMVNEQPIYYRGYRDYLNGQKKLEELMGSSKVQSALIAELVFLLRSQLTDGYLLFSSHFTELCQEF